MIVINRSANTLSLYHGLEAVADVPRRHRPVGLPDAARPLPHRRQVGEPVVVPADLGVGAGLRARAAGPGQPARHALDGPLVAGRRHPRHARTRVDRLQRLARLHPHAGPDAEWLFDHVDVGTTVFIV